MAISYKALAIFSSLLHTATAHSWVEEYQVISSNGLYTGSPGYSRGYVPHSAFPALHNGDKSMNYELPASVDASRFRINSSDPICMPSQRTSNYTNPSFPRLRASPGDYVAMKYLENGHVTLPWTLPGKPDQGGTIFVYGTNQPSDTETLLNVLKWTADGKGGDGRGFLMSAQNFDDGRCHQMNDCTLSAERQIIHPNHIPGQTAGSGIEQWCESDVRIPASQKTGTLTTYWVWQWNTAPGADCNYFAGKDEYYTTCADFDIVDAVKLKQKLVALPGASVKSLENVQTAAVSNWASRTAIITAPIVTTAPTTSAHGIAGRDKPVSSSYNSTFWSSCSSAAARDAAIIKAGKQPPPPPACPDGKWATGSLFAAISASLKAAARASDTPVSNALPTLSSSMTSSASPSPSSSSSPAQLATTIVTTLITRVRTVYATELPSSTAVPLMSSSSSSSIAVLSASTASLNTFANKALFSTLSTISAPVASSSVTSSKVTTSNDDDNACEDDF